MRRKFNVKAEADGEAPHKVVAQLLCEDYPLFSFRFFDDSTVKKARDQERPRHVTRPGGAPFQPRVRPITAQGRPRRARVRVDAAREQAEAHFPVLRLSHGVLNRYLPPLFRPSPASMLGISPTARCFFLSTTLAYICVVDMSAWPRSFDTV